MDVKYSNRLVFGNKKEKGLTLVELDIYQHKFINIEKKKRKNKTKKEKKAQRPVAAKPITEKGRNNISGNRYNYSWPLNRTFWIRPKSDQMPDPKEVTKLLSS